MIKAWCTAVALAGLVSVFGCGGDENSTPPQGQGYSGFGGGAAAAGIGGSVSTATAGTTGAGPVACGTTMCSTPALPPGLPIMPLPACCANPATSTCGTMSGGTCMMPPAAAPLCPAPMFFGMTLRACCATGNVCGIDASMLGMGCINASAIPGQGGARPVTMCDGTVVQPPPTTTPTAGTGAPTAGTTGTVAGAGGATVAGGAGGAGGATATSGAGGSSTVGGAGGSSATAGAGGARAGTGGAAAGTGAGAAGRMF